MKTPVISSKTLQDRKDAAGVNVFVGTTITALSLFIEAYRVVAKSS